MLKSLALLVPYLAPAPLSKLHLCVFQAPYFVELVNNLASSSGKECIKKRGLGGCEEYIVSMLVALSRR